MTDAEAVGASISEASTTKPKTSSFGVHRVLKLFSLRI